MPAWYRAEPNWGQPTHWTRWPQRLATAADRSLMADRSLDDRDTTAGAPGCSRRELLARLGAASAVAWTAPAIVGTSRAVAAGSACPVVYSWEDNTLQGWTVTTYGGSSAQWQLSSTAASSGSRSMWFGTAGSTNSLHPTVGAASYSGGTPRGALTSPAVTVTATDTISFKLRLAIENHASYDRFALNIVQGTKRRELWNKHAGGFAVVPHPENPGAIYDLFTTNGAFVTITVTVGNPGGGINLANPVRFEFDFQGGDGNYNRTEGIFIDGLSLPCTVPPAGAPQSRKKDDAVTGPPAYNAPPRKKDKSG
jgi:hypothetical protein